MHTRLGAGGAIGLDLLNELVGKGQRVRLVGRNPSPAHEAAEVVAADLTRLDQTVQAVSGSAVVYLLVGLKYDLAVWREQWPRIMQNTIEACKRAKARLVFFDNVYMYGKVNGPMREDTPFNPSSKKGEVRQERAWNQTWHLPTRSNPPTGKQFIELVAREFGVPAKQRVLGRPMIKTAGLFDSTVRAGGKLSWDSANMRFPNLPAADQYLTKNYRAGWRLV